MADARCDASAIWIEWGENEMSAIQNPKFVVCLRNDDYPVSLERHKIYQVLPDEDAAQDGDLRIIDESGEDYLYPRTWFVPIALPTQVELSFRQAA